MSAPPTSDATLESLLRLAGANLGDERARFHLATTLEAIPFILRARSKRRPQADRNRDLGRLASAARRLRVACSSIDLPTEAKIEEAAAGEGLTFDGISLVAALKRLETWAHTAKAPAVKSADVEITQAISALATFVLRFGDCAISAKSDGRFLTFAREAMQAAGYNGPDDLSRRVRSLQSSGRLDQLRERAGVEPTGWGTTH